MYILSLDFGTSSLKLSIVDEKLNLIKSVKKGYEFRVFDTDKVELSSEDVFNAFIEGTKEIEEYVNDIAAVAYDVFSPSVVFMDKSGKVLHPIITHLDRRSRTQSKEIVKEMGANNFQKITGTFPFTGGASITTIMWVKENMPEIYNNAFKIGHLNTFIHFKLTKKWVTDYVNATMTAMYETITCNGWSKDITSTFGINIGKLPDVFQAGVIEGTLCKEISQLTNLREGIPVIVGSNDCAVSHIGAGNDNSGDILNTAGSNEILSILTDKPITNKEYYLRKAVNKDKWQIFCITTGGFAIEWFRKNFYEAMDVNEFYNQYLVDVIGNRMDPGTVKFLPYLAGDRQSLMKKRGGFHGLTLGSTKEEMLVSLLYGTHDPLLKTLEIAKKSIQLNNTIKVTGGLANDSYSQLKKVLFKKYNMEVVDDCTIIGNAKLALEAIKR
jgi:xylulokinase